MTQNHQKWLASKRLLRGACLLICMLLAACGTVAAPVLQRPSATPLVAEAAALESTATAPPTSTPLPPTLTPTPLPTETATPAPTESPVPTNAPVMSPIDRMAAARDAENGAVLFQIYQEAAKYSCANCHSPTSEKPLVGPGLLNVKDRAARRVEGQSAAEYIYTSIIDPKAHVLEGYETEMPENWAEIYRDLEIFDLVAYLLTLEGESDLDEPDAPPVDMSIYGEIALPDTANAERGAELFQTTQAETGYACAACHFTDTESRLIGPGLLNIGSRAETRVEGQSGIEYIFTAIVNPSEFVVPDFDDGLEPRNHVQVFNEADLYDLTAYLLTLEG